MEFILIRKENEGDDELTEVPLEKNHTLSLETLQGQFPDAAGLCYINDETQRKRGLRLIEGVIQPPNGIESDCPWGENIVYYVIFPKKALSPNVETENSTHITDSVCTSDERDNRSREKKHRSDTKHEYSDAKTKRIETRTSELVVMGLPFSFESEDLKSYFNKFGDVDCAEVKKHRDSGKSRGYGFIKFKDYSVQKKALAKRHFDMANRTVEVMPSNKTINCAKLYVGNLNKDVSRNDLRDYFSQFADVENVFRHPSYDFGFITLAEPSAVSSLCDMNHTLRGISLVVKPGTEQRKSDSYSMNDKPVKKKSRFSNEDPYGMTAYQNSFVPPYYTAAPTTSYPSYGFLPNPEVPTDQPVVTSQSNVQLDAATLFEAAKVLANPSVSGFLSQTSQK